MGALAISASEYVTYFSIILGAKAPHSAETMINNLIVLTLRNTCAMNVENAWNHSTKRNTHGYSWSGPYLSTVLPKAAMASS
jgi:hypothetical protein